MSRPTFKMAMMAAALMVSGGIAMAAVPAAVAGALSAAPAPLPANAAASAPAHKAKANPPAKPPKAAKLIDINSASREQLKTLPGLSDEQIDMLIAKRPYLTKADLVTSGVMPAGVYVALKRKLIAVQKLPLQLKK